MQRPRPFLVLLATALFAGLGQSEEPAVITHIAEARALPRDETAQAREVLLRGVVTWRGTGSFIFQDESAGIYVNVDLAKKRGLWRGESAGVATVRLGAVVEVEGVTDRGGFSPPILPRLLRVVGELPLPPARLAVPARFFSGVEDCQRIEVRGVVQGFSIGKAMATLTLNANPGAFEATIPRSQIPPPETLVDAEVRLTGPLHSRFNTRGEFIMPSIALNRAEDLVIEKPARAGPFNAPKVALADLARFRTQPLNAHRLRTEGTLIYAASPDLLFLQDGSTAIRARRSRGDRVQVGDRVEVAGFVDETRVIRGLIDVVARKLGPGVVEAPLRVGPDEILAVNATSAATSLMAQPGDFDGRLIRFPAQLMALYATPNRQRMLLSTESSTILATLVNADPRTFEGLLPGSKVEVTGIANLGSGNDSSLREKWVPAGVELLLRTREDVTLLEPPAWWTPRRVTMALAGVAMALFAAIVWLGMLRRRVQIQATQLAEEMRARREGLVEFQATLRERNRLAANLHDTLLQTVGGIGYQLDACQVSTEQGQAARASHLEMARRMVDHAVGEMRGSVWALRALPLHGRAFPEALHELARHVAQGHPVRVEVRVEDDVPVVPELVAGNLLLMSQEALHNALKHGQPKTVEIVARAAREGLQLTIRDDGAGFIPGEQEGPEQGHFGLAGMKERVDRLGGSLQIESAPGRGTTVCAQVPLSADEAEM